MQIVEFSFVLRIPERYSGAIVGELAVQGATLESISVADGIWTIRAKSGEKCLVNFEAWLVDFTDGSATIERDKLS